VEVPRRRTGTMAAIKEVEKCIVAGGFGGGFAVLVCSEYGKL